MQTEIMAATIADSTIPLIASGKVRDLYEIDSHTLLFVASDRISAFDVVMKNVGLDGILRRLDPHGILTCTGRSKKGYHFEPADRTLVSLSENTDTRSKDSFRHD